MYTIIVLFELLYYQITISMSLAIQAVQPVKVVDPIVDLNEQVFYGILKSGSRHTYKTFVSTSYSNNSAVFSAPPPNQRIIVDRQIFLRQPVTLSFAGAAADQSLLLSGYDAFRAYPLSSIIETLEININDVAVSINMADVIKPLLHYHNNCRDLGERGQSMTPSQMDQSQTYAQLANSIRNPLNPYVNGLDGAYMGRGGFPMDVASNTDSAAEISAVLTEPLMLSPLLFGRKDNEDGFLGVQTFTCTVNWKTDLSRMWSHDSSGGSSLTSVTVTLGQPSLLFHYITPPLMMPIKQTYQYPLLIIDRYPTDANSDLAAGASTTLSSSNINLNSIPRIMYIFARKRNADLTYEDADSYLSIENISVNWNNNAGLLSEASKERLYQISVKNGVNMNYTQWSADDQHYLGNGVDNTINGTGSILALEFGTDIGLMPNEAPGLLGNYQFQMEITVTNKSTDSINPTLYIITHSEGVFTIDNARSYKQVGVLTHNDIVDAATERGINYASLKYMSGSAIDFKKLYEKASDLYGIVGPKLGEIKDCTRLAKNLYKDIRHGRQYGPTAAPADYYGDAQGSALMNRSQMRRSMRGNHRY